MNDLSCSYYWWDGDYACRKSGKTVDEDIYYKYCRGYDYSDCPIYKQESSSGGCYLTSACVRARNLPDNCEELTVLRSFRDNWLAGQPCGKCEIAEYYRIAPKIVETINLRADAQEIWDRLYQELIWPCVCWIKDGEMEKAHRLYREVSVSLQNTYCAIN